MAGRLHRLVAACFRLFEDGDWSPARDRREGGGKEAGPFALVLRSKGFLWLAGTKSALVGLWSQAGQCLSLAGQGHKK
jgi:hypothetical protein